MAIDVSSITEYSDADLLKLYRHCMATGAAGTTRQINGRMIQIPELDKLMKAIDWLEGRINAAAEPENGGLGLVGFGERI
jgi:hypothetical protein